MTVWSDDPAVADGLARRVAGMFGGSGRWQGLRTGEPSRLERFGGRARVVLIVVITAAITGTVTAIVTIIVTKLLSGH